MKEKLTKFDFMYALKHAKILKSFEGVLDIHSNRQISYTLLTRSMDTPATTIIRTGFMNIFPPDFAEINTFFNNLKSQGDMASPQFAAYFESHRDEVKVMRYRFQLDRKSYKMEKSNAGFENLCTEISKNAINAGNPDEVVLTGIDEPWDVNLLHVFVKILQASVPENTKKMLEQKSGQSKNAVSIDNYNEIEKAFKLAEKDSGKIQELSQLLIKTGSFELYQDRFFALINNEDKKL